MDAVHIHLMSNHLPVLLTFFSLLLLAWGWLRDQSSFVYLALIGYVLAAVFAFVAFQSGEGTEDIVEDLAGVTHQLIEDHEHAAEWTYYLALLQGVLALLAIGLLKIKSSLTRYLIPLLWALSLYVAGIFFYTAYTGGQIRHSEIRPEQTTSMLHTIERPSYTSIDITD